MSEKRYSVWPNPGLAADNGPDYRTIEEARADQSRGNDKWRIWDHSTTPPTDVTDADPEGGHPPTVPLIPEGVTAFTFKRGAFGAEGVHVEVIGPSWSAKFWTTEDDLFTDMHKAADTFWRP